MPLLEPATPAHLPEAPDQSVHLDAHLPEDLHEEVNLVDVADEGDLEEPKQELVPGGHRRVEQAKHVDAAVEAEDESEEEHEGGGDNDHQGLPVGQVLPRASLILRCPFIFCQVLAKKLQTSDI